MLMLRFLKRAAQSDDLHKLDSKKLATVIAPYISFYTQQPIYRSLRKKHINAYNNINHACTMKAQNTIGCERDTKWKGKGKGECKIHTPKKYYTEHYENISVKPITKVPYTQPQTYLFLDFTTGTVSEEMQKKLAAVTENPEHFSIFGEELDTEDDYQQKGRIIGNLALKKDRLQTNSTKTAMSDIVAKVSDDYWKPASAKESRRQSERDRSKDSTYYEYSNGEVIPLKFIIILNRILETPGQTAVFSHFKEHGTDAFAEYVRYVSPAEKGSEAKMKIPKYIERRSAFSDTETVEVPFIEVATFGEASPAELGSARIVLLPNVTEGADLSKPRQLHIMEPVMTFSDSAQLYARINRFQSEKEADSGNKFIYRYCMETTDFCDHLLMKLKQWHHSQHKQKSWVFWKRFTKFDQDITPDAILMNKQLHAEKLVEKLKSRLGPLLHLQHNTLIQDPTDKKKRQKYRRMNNVKLWLATDVEAYNDCLKGKCSHKQVLPIETADDELNKAPSGSVGRKSQKRGGSIDTLEQLYRSSQRA